ncbi:MAG: ATP-binding protein, partial [Chloroflexota bacterium]
MSDQNQSKEQLIEEVNTLHARIAELETLESKRKQVEHALMESLEQIERAKQQWEVTADSLPQLICLINHQGRIIRTNRTIERWNLGKVVTITGKRIDQLLPTDRTDSAQYFEAFLRDAWKGLTQGKSANIEVEDKRLKRHLHLYLQPTSLQTGRKGKATDSFAVLIIDDITDRKQSDRLKHEFLSNIGQNLQTPLNSILGYSQIMLTGVEGELDPKIREDVEAIYDNGQELLSYIKEIIDLAEIESGNSTLSLEDVPIEAILSQLNKQYGHLLKDTDLALTMTIAEDLPFIRADRLRLDQILRQVMANAIKFTKKGRIDVEAYQEDQWLCVAVSDTGLGISESDQEIIFEKFRQVDGSLSRRQKGSGLGLTIAHHLTQLHGGHIKV